MIIDEFSKTQLMQHLHFMNEKVFYNFDKNSNQIQFTDNEIANIVLLIK